MTRADTDQSRLPDQSTLIALVPDHRSRYRVRIERPMYACCLIPPPSRDNRWCATGTSPRNCRFAGRCLALYNDRLLFQMARCIASDDRSYRSFAAGSTHFARDRSSASGILLSSPGRRTNGTNSATPEFHDKRASPRRSPGFSYGEMMIRVPRIFAARFAHQMNGASRISLPQPAPGSADAEPSVTMAQLVAAPHALAPEENRAASRPEPAWENSALPSKRTNSPLKLDFGSPHNLRITSMYSQVRCARPFEGDSQ